MKNYDWIPNTVTAAFSYQPKQEYTGIQWSCSLIIICLHKQFPCAGISFMFINMKGFVRHYYVFNDTSDKLSTPVTCSYVDVMMGFHTMCFIHIPNPHHTLSSCDISNGFTYSKPSNSVWSIFPITLL